MSAASIVYVGDDDCYRIPVFKTAGYHVDSCASFAQLHQALIRVPPADAVAVVDSVEELPRKTVSLVRATTSIPLILFRNAPPPCLDGADFDLIVPAPADPRMWVAEIQRLIEESRALRARSQAIRHESAMLAEKSALLREDAATVREKSLLEIERSKIEIERKCKG